MSRLRTQKLSGLWSQHCNFAPNYVQSLHTHKIVFCPLYLIFMIYALLSYNLSPDIMQFLANISMAVRQIPQSFCFLDVWFQNHLANTVIDCSCFGNFCCSQFGKLVCKGSSKVLKLLLQKNDVCKQTILLHSSFLSHK